MLHMQAIVNLASREIRNFKRIWDIKQSIKRIKVPTLVIGAKYDTMIPCTHMEWNGQKEGAPNGTLNLFLP